ncbi:MAG: DNA translocase FtsK [Clostridia bacterium]|nr:DNA translocase FtsK [Clostridia bacterium]
MSKEELKVKRDERAVIRAEKKQQRLLMLEEEKRIEAERAAEQQQKEIPESFDFNETEIEYDPIDRETGKPLRPLKPFTPKDQLFTYADGEKPKATPEEEKFEIDFISSPRRSKPAAFPRNEAKAQEAEKDIHLSEVTEENIDDFVPDDDTLSADASEIVRDAIKTANAKLKKNMDDVSSYKEEKKKVKKEYRLPPIECLNEPIFNNDEDFAGEMRVTAKKLVDVLKSFGVETTLIGVSRGPSVTRYELSPAPGVKISKIINLIDDIALGLAASGVRIEAPIPGKSAVGIEVPNKTRSTVTLREIISSAEYNKHKGKLLTVALGKDIAGNINCADLSKMPHLLIAGTTGSGKSVCLNGMIASILYNATPSEVKLLMIDPKQVEFTVYNGIPHLLVPVITDARKAAGSLAWAVSEMDNRYKTFAQCGVRDIGSFNKYIKDHPELQYMPQIVIFIDELNDLMMVSPKEVEDSICRLAQKARAAGMHLVVATQRPSVDVITGLIKANIPSRLSLSVSSQVDSRTVLDCIGAEKLLGNGDMLFSPVGISKPVRIQGAYLSDEEIEKIVDFIKEQENAEYDDEIMDEIERNAVADKKKGGSSGGGSIADDSDGEYDDMLDDAVNVITELNSASTTVLQRKLRVGYARAARIMDELEQLGYVSAAEGNKPRKVLVSRSQYLEMKAGADVANDDFDILSD